MDDIKEGVVPIDRIINVKMTASQALALGILVCECGHPRNNHFQFDSRPCARCACKACKEQISLPKAL